MKYYDYEINDYNGDKETVANHICKYLTNLQLLRKALSENETEDEEDDEDDEDEEADKGVNNSRGQEHNMERGKTPGVPKFMLSFRD